MSLEELKSESSNSLDEKLSAITPIEAVRAGKGYGKVKPSVEATRAEAIEYGITPGFLAKSNLINESLSEIGMGRYQWKVSNQRVQQSLSTSTPSPTLIITTYVLTSAPLKPHSCLRLPRFLTLRTMSGSRVLPSCNRRSQTSGKDTPMSGCPHWPFTLDSYSARLFGASRRTSLGGDSPGTLRS